MNRNISRMTPTRFDAILVPAQVQPQASLPMTKLLSLFVVLLAAAAVFTAQQSDLGKMPPPAGLVAKDVAPAPAAVISFLEGPAVDGAGNVFFSDIAGNRIHKMDTKGTVTVFRADSGRTNGNCFDAQGRLVSCEGSEQ